MTSPVTPPPDVPTEPDSILAALQAVLVPLARLAVAHGVPYQRVDEVVRRALVDAAVAAHPDLPASRGVSRISTTVGLNRREVTRLTRPQAAPQPPRASPATRLFLRWQSDRRLRDAQGQPAVLPRLGPAPSFEHLAHEITRDVHPRSLLGELVRLNLARHDEANDTVALQADAFVPRGDKDRMLGFVGANVGDHLAAAVANVLGDGRAHFEQAVFADELSEASIAQLRASIARQWQSLLASMVPELEALIESDRAAGRRQDQRVRIGLFSYTDRMPEADPAPADEIAARPRPTERGS